MQGQRNNQQHQGFSDEWSSADHSRAVFSVLDLWSTRGKWYLGPLQLGKEDRQRRLSLSVFVFPRSEEEKKRASVTADLSRGEGVSADAEGKIERSAKENC